MSRNKIILFDICGTLFFSNTSFDFLDSIVKAKSYRFFRKFSKTILARIINKFSVVVFDKDLIRNIAVLYLRGLSKTELNAKANEFYNDFLYSHRIKETFDKIEFYRDMPNTTVVLASATFDFIAEVVADKLKIPIYFGTELDYDSQGVFKGVIKKDRLGHKYQAALDMGFLPPFEKVVTDNITDLDIINKSETVDLIIYPWTERKWSRRKNSIMASIENEIRYGY